MNIYIEIQEVVANALIGLLKKNEKSRVVFFDDLDKYGTKVVEELNKKQGVNAIFIVSRESQQAMVEDYTEIFTMVEEQGRKGIKLNDGISEDYLWERFCSSLAWIVVAAFRSEEACRVLGD